MEEYKIGIVIPAFNEQDSLAKLIPIIKNYGNVLVINDGSTDETQKIINQFKCQYIKNEKNLGYEKSIIKGLKFFINNNFDYILTFDADGQHDVEDLKKILKFGIDKQLIICSRKKLNRFSEYFLSIYFYFKYKVKDPLSGMKLFKVDILKEIELDNFDKNFMVDLIQHLLIKKVSFINVDISTKDRIDKPRVGNNFKANIKILKVLLNSIFF